MGDEQARASARQQLFGTLSGANAFTGANLNSDGSAMQTVPNALAAPLDNTPVAPVIGDSPYAPRRQPAVRPRLRLP